MKAKVNYKKRRNIIIGLIAAVVAVIAIGGSVAFIKGNRSASATMEENNISENANANANANSTENNENQTDNVSNNAESTTSIENGEINNNTNNQNGTDGVRNNSRATSLSQNSGDAQRNNTQSRANSASTNNSNVPNREYIQTTIIPNGGEERLVSEDEKIGWRPITVSAKTAVAEIDLVEPNIESHKLSYINDDSTNDEPIHSTVQKNDTITYVIQVVNHGDVEAKGINIYDSIPTGTELVEGSISDDGTIANGRISWKKDIPANNEETPVKVSFKVKVLLKDAEEKEITLIDNQAIVNGKPTEETHNPAVTAVKKVNVVANDGTLLDNKTVVPGTRLRYTVVLTNSTEYYGVTKVTDRIPEGTSIIDNSISEGGKLENGIITWETVKVPANSEAEVYFDVTVNKDTRTTVKNIAKIGNNDEPSVPEELENPESPEDPTTPEDPDNTYTNEVRTPVFVASKTSVLDGEKVRETNTVEYVITVKNVGNPQIEEENIEGTAKLYDQYWVQDTDKMEFAEGIMIITDNDGEVISKEEVDEEFLKNIEVTLNAGNTATITYTATVNAMDKEIPNEGLVVDDIANNLYWSKSENPDEPSRPENPNDPSSPVNPTNPDDPTKPTPDPDDENSEEPIDTVIIEVEEKYIEIEASKTWIDADNEYETRPENVTFKLFRGYDLENQDEDMNESVTLSSENSWKAKFSKLKESDAEGRKYVYTVKEDEIKNYTTTYSEDKLTVINKYTNPMVQPEKKVEVVKLTENGEVTTSDLAPNAIVEPGTRLRYTITLTNETEVDGYVNVEDTVPAGTTLYKEENISEAGKYDAKTNTITWNKVKVPSAEGNTVGTSSVYFDVTVNKNQKETVSNFATITIPTIPEEPVNPENPENPQEPGEQEKPEDTVITTPEVKTPVFIASKKSVSDYNSETKTPKLHEENEVTYVVTITNSANPSDEKEKDLTGTARLEDKFWKEDLNKMTYKSGTLEIKNAEGRTTSTTEKEESYLSDIEVTLKAGESATLTYVYTINTMKEEDIERKTENGITYEWDEISNNLYWAVPEVGEPSRPTDTRDTTNYENTDPNDPTPAMPDPEDKDKPGLIDTVIVHAEEEYINIQATKSWNDKDDEYKDRPNSVDFTLYKNGVTTGITLSPSKNNNWKVTFEHLRRTDVNGRAYTYTLKENSIQYYNEPEASYSVDSNNNVTITNSYGPKFIASKTSKQNGNTLEETNIITYVVTISNIGRTEGTTTLRDLYRNNDSSKLTFVPGSITIDGKATSNTESYLNKMTITLKPDETRTITYQYKVKVQDKNSMTYDSVNNKYTTTITNDLFWGKNNDTDPEDPRYPTNTPIDTVTVNVEKLFVSFTAEKNWDDSNNANKQRPSKIAFILQDFASNSNGVDVTPKNEKILSSSNQSPNDANKWTVDFTDLPKYNSDGKVAIYGIREEGIVTQDGKEIRESYVRNYQAEDSSDHKSIKNKYHQDITGKVTATNVTESNVPLDVVFVLDISSSMLAGSDGKTNYTTNRASNMVKAVNEEIKTIMANNPKNRVGIELFNSNAQKLLDLGIHTANTNGKYISYSNRVITLTVDGKTKSVTIPTSDSYYECGTYTQSGVFRATKDLFKTDSKTDYKVTLSNGETVSRTPVLILLTDGDPTHYDTNTSNVANEPPNTIYPGDAKSIGRVRYCKAEDYAYTMKTISTCKNWITSKYDKACKLYTIGLNMEGSMAKALLNPTTANINKMNNISTSTSDISLEIYNTNDEGKPHTSNSVKITGNDLTYYQNNYNGRLVKAGSSYYLINKNYYVWQQMRLYNILNGITTSNNGARNTYGTNLKLASNYTDKTFTTSMSAADMQKAFREAITLSSESSYNININESFNRRIELTDIDTSKEFKIKIFAVSNNGANINIDKTFASFSAALSDSIVKAYIKGSYYVDISNLRSGTVNIVYGKK